MRLIRKSLIFESDAPDRASSCGNRADRQGFYFRQVLFAAFFGVLAVSLPIMAAPLQLPPVVEPATQEHHPGKLIFVELVTPDLITAKAFYGRLFGWTFRDIQGGRKEYAEALLNGTPVAGLIQRDIRAGERKQPAWLSFFSVGDVALAKNVALQNGAKVLFGPRDLPLRGQEAVFRDPQGAVFAVLSSSSGDPPDILVSPGEWIWSTLITIDPDTDAAFYQKLFNYEVFDLPEKSDAQHLLLASGGYARASVNSFPTDRLKAYPHWLNFVRVEDAVKTAGKVVTLGGRVLVEPRVDRHGGKIAVVADPLGAAFGLLEWQENESKEVSK